ncbi:MAG: redoxin domain-containing protein [Myxococcales bacterium]|nr:redoxin domain-containing protein [Myxococcales bacterium]
MAQFPPAPNLTKALGELKLLDSEGAAVTISSLWAKQPCLIRHVRSFSSLGCRSAVQGLLAAQRRFDEHQLKLAIIVPEEVAKTKQWRLELRVPGPVLADPEKLSFQAVGAKEINWGTPENIRGMSKTSLSTSVRLNRSMRFNPATHLMEAGGRPLFCWLNTNLKDDCTVNQILDALDDL